MQRIRTTLTAIEFKHAFDNRRPVPTTDGVIKVASLPVGEYRILTADYLSLVLDHTGSGGGWLMRAED